MPNPTVLCMKCAEKRMAIREMRGEEPAETAWASGSEARKLHAETEGEEMIFVGGPYGLPHLEPGGVARPCDQGCGEIVYVSPSSFWLFSKGV